MDVLHYDLELAVSDTTRRIEGRARLRILAREAPAGPLSLDFSGLAVTDARANGAPAEFVQDPGHVRLALPEGIAAGDTFQVEVRYEGTPDDGLDLGRTVHGLPSAFADNWPNRARFWFPSVDHPSDKATVRFTIHAPAEWEVVANGRRLESPAPLDVPAQIRSADRSLPAPRTPPPSPAEPRTWTWEESVPIPTYGMVFGATRLVHRTVGLAACGHAPASPRADGCVEVGYWVFPSDTSAAQRSFRRAAEVVDTFTALVGRFPYERLDHVQSATRFGGMENPSVIFYDQRSLASGRDIEATMVHETAHQWFGDAVTEAQWSHLWLSEGFATYFTALFYEKVEGAERFRAMMEENRQRVLRSPVAGRPVVDSTYASLFDLLNANSYQKGAWVLHMLRNRVGDDAFFRAVRRYYREHLNGTALTEDLRRVMEAESGEDLAAFFRQWVFEPGFPVVQADLDWDPERSEAVVSVSQEQPEDWPTFHFDLVVELRTDGGPVRATLPVRSRADIFRVKLPAPPSALTLDPDVQLLALLRLRPRTDPQPACFSTTSRSSSSTSRRYPRR